MMHFPNSKEIEICRLGQLYNNTVATYKYYWFLSLLEIFVKNQKSRISFWEIIVGMITEAWYPIHYFKLSFGKSDSLYQQIVALQQEFNIPIDINKEDLRIRLNKDIDNPRIRNLLNVFTLNVPYRFLSPWITYTTDKAVVLQSQSFTNNCLYSIEEGCIEVNEKWRNYLSENFSVLRDFTFWNLTVFLQKRNPNVPDLPSKLSKPIQRDSLTKQRHFWNMYIDISGSIDCIFTGKVLQKKQYDLDHFVPWSYVSHNLIWNLLPIDSVVNSSKSDNLPKLDIYLRPYASIHQKAIKEIYAINPNNVLLEDYLTVHSTIHELISFSEDDFFNIFQKTFSPMVQIAENMGFKYWNNSYPR